MQLKSNIELWDGVDQLELYSWKFPMGEVGIKIIKPEKVNPINLFHIVVHYRSSDDIILCLQLVDALKSLGVRPGFMSIHIPYLPYGRQDRVCHPGEAFSLRVILDVLRTTGCFVTTTDLHSDVAFKQLHAGFLHNKNQESAAFLLPKFDYLIAPDKGASSKVSKHNQVARLNTSVVVLNKQRIGSSIVYIDLDYDTIKGTACVVDDICDGGGTFLSLAEMLKRTQPNLKSLNLYVTHGGFTQGLDKLKTLYDNIYVHNLMNQISDPVLKLI